MNVFLSIEKPFDPKSYNQMLIEYEETERLTWMGGFMEIQHWFPIQNCLCIII